jgi:hypothetical protein
MRRLNGVMESYQVVWVDGPCIGRGASVVVPGKSVRAAALLVQSDPARCQIEKVYSEASICHHAVQ